MIFYRTQTEPPQLVGTQADAKTTGVPWEQHDVPVDKAGLMAYVNALLAVEPPSLTGNCPVCLHTPRQAEILSKVYSFAQLVTLAGRVEDPKLIDRMISALEERKTLL